MGISSLVLPTRRLPDSSQRPDKFRHTLIRLLVGALGLEPETSAVSKQRSTTELRAHNQGHTAKVCTLVVPHRQKHASLLRKAGVDGAEGGTRTPTSYLTRPSNVRVYQFRHFGSSLEGCLMSNKLYLVELERQTEACRTAHGQLLISSSALLKAVSKRPVMLRESPRLESPEG